VQRLRDLIGYRVLGRHGELGIVVDEERVEGPMDSSTMVVRGGISDALLFYVPATRLLSVSRDANTIRVDADVGDFLARLGSDGTIELYVSP
jgi:hypothetical protein